MAKMRSVDVLPASSGLECSSCNLKIDLAFDGLTFD